MLKVFVKKEDWLCYFVKKKYNIPDKITLITADREPSLWAVFDTKYDQKEDSDHMIIINYKNLKNKINLKEYKIINKFKDCYYLIKND